MKRIVIMFFYLCFTFSIFAETIVLKSGRTVEAKITEKNNDSIKVDFYGTVLTYYLEDIKSIDDKPINAIDSQLKTSGHNLSLSSNTQFFNDTAFGLSFEYPSHWEIIPKEKLPVGWNIGLRPKEKESTVDLLFQYNYLPDKTIEKNASLKDYLTSIYPPKDYVIGSMTGLYLGNVSGYLIKLISKEKTGTRFTHIEELQGENAILPSLSLADIYFITNAFNQQKKDDRFVQANINFVEYYDMYPEVENSRHKEILHNLELNTSFKNENTNTARYCEEARKIINSLRFPGVDN